MSSRARENQRLLNLITTLFYQHDGNYGCPRIYKALRALGETVNHKRVERLMKSAGLVGKAGRIYRRKSLPKNSCIQVDNKQRVIGMPTRPNQQWAGDVTYLKVNGSWLYLAVVLDLYSRKVVGWQFSTTRTAALTLSAFNHAVRARSINKELLFHSDRGSEYGAHRYQKRLRQLGVKPSMNRAGFMNDNVYVESFFQTLKTECFKGLSFNSMADVKKKLGNYISNYYNVKRIHSALDFKSPENYERINP